jgi:hypothetical protein
MEAATGDAYIGSSLDSRSWMRLSMWREREGLFCTRARIHMVDGCLTYGGRGDKRGAHGITGLFDDDFISPGPSSTILPSCYPV